MFQHAVDEIFAQKMTETLTFWVTLLRHSAATLLLSLHVHPKVVQELLGHTQISMTMDIYSHVLPGIQQDAIGRLNDALRLPKIDEHQQKS
jgi:site-specific recombinase XerD